jgi:hypothetical protein
MMRFIALTTLCCLSAQAIAGAAPIRIVYEGRFVDLDRRLHPGLPLYCNVQGEFIIDEELPEDQLVISATMVIEEKGLSLSAPVGWRRSGIDDDVRLLDDYDGTFDRVWFLARFAGLGGVMSEEDYSLGYDLEDPSSDDWVTWQLDRGFGITISLLGSTSWFDPTINPITRGEGIATYDLAVGWIDFRNWRLSDESTYSKFEVTRIEIVPEPKTSSLMQMSIFVCLTFIFLNARWQRVRL